MGRLPQVFQQIASELLIEPAANGTTRQTKNLNMTSVVRATISFQLIGFQVFGQVRLARCT